MTDSANSQMLCLKKSMKFITSGICRDFIQNLLWLVTLYHHKSKKN